MSRSHLFYAAVLFVAATILSACRTVEVAEPLRPAPIGALPAVTAVDGPLEISVIHPPPNQVRPSVDSTFVFGSVGTGRASLTINGEPVPVAANGAFLAFVPIPSEGTFRFEARADGETASHVYTYRPVVRRAPEAEPIVPARLGIVRNAGRDTVDTGSETAYATVTPDGARLAFMLPEARVQVTGRLGNQLRVQFSQGREAWIPAESVELQEGGLEPPSAVTGIEVAPAARHVDLRLGGDRVPFVIRTEARALTATVYHIDGRQAPAIDTSDPWIANAVVSGAGADSMQVRLDLNGPLWGYKAFYDDEGGLTLRMRRPPQRAGSGSLAGLRILIDPGHPPLGATGPTGLTEADANLAIALPLRDMLRERGADVIMTRDDATPMVSATDVAAELWARVAYSVEQDADLLISVHNNAFPDGVNPFEHHGAEVYFFHRFSEDLASALSSEIVRVTGTRDKGAIQRSLALVRPTWMPSVLTESLYMMFPQQEAALRDPAFVRRLAEAHVRGIERFVSERFGE
jgi:N-acetylmuramoyl-L-alanine amidase